MLLHFTLTGEGLNVHTAAFEIGVFVITYKITKYGGVQK